MKVYVASSFRNEHQPAVVELLRQAGHQVYDYRNPDVDGPGAAPGAGFGWEQVHPSDEAWTPLAYLEALRHPLAAEGFAADWAAMQWADRFVLVMPCGRSAHLEAGYAVGAGKPLAVLLERADPGEPELMYKAASLITASHSALLAWFDTTLPNGRNTASDDMGWCQCCGPSVDVNGNCLCTAAQCGTQHPSEPPLRTNPPHITVPGVAPAGTGCWQARCRCAWAGHPRCRFADAQDDLNEHLDTCREAVPGMATVSAQESTND